MSHELCKHEGKHVCQEPSGRVCIEVGCLNPAGTWWGPMWCPQHDQERLERISGQLEDLVKSAFPDATAFMISTAPEVPRSTERGQA